jgi:hypothetical protein
MMIELEQGCNRRVHCGQDRRAVKTAKGWTFLKIASYPYRIDASQT